MEERHMPTNRENKPNGSAAKTGNGWLPANGRQLQRRS